MKKEDFIESLNSNCKIDNENTWSNIMPEIDFLFESFENKLKESENIILSALSDLKIDGHTKRGVYNAIAVLEKSAKTHENRELLADDIVDTWIEPLEIESKNFSATLENTQNIVAHVLNKIYG